MLSSSTRVGQWPDRSILPQKTPISSYGKVICSFAHRNSEKFSLTIMLHRHFSL